MARYKRITRHRRGGPGKPDGLGEKTRGDDRVEAYAKAEELARLQRLVELYQSEKETTDAGSKNEEVRQEEVRRKGMWHMAWSS